MKKIFYILLIFEITYSQKLQNAEDFEVSEPEPKVVVPGRNNSPPSDAIVLFDGSNFSSWHHSKTYRSVRWKLNNDKTFTIKTGTGSIETKKEHGSVQLHIEWKSPIETKGEGQMRGNSGIFFQRRYEVQVLNSYQNKTYSDGQAGSIYKQHIPLVNSMRPTGEWQVYDIIFNAPKYNDTGKIIKSGSFTVFHNGVLIQNNVEIKKPTMSIERGTKKTLMLQDHDPNGTVSYRNIWMRNI